MILPASAGVSLTGRNGRSLVFPIDCVAIGNPAEGPFGGGFCSLRGMVLL